MSQDIVLISIGGLKNSDIENFLSKHWRVGEIECINGVIDLQVNTIDEKTKIFSYVTVGQLIPSHEVANDYVDHDMVNDELKSSLDTCNYYMITFNCCNLLENVMRKILIGIGSSIDTCWIDDGYGRLLPARVFLENCKSTND